MKKVSLTLVSRREVLTAAPVAMLIGWSPVFAQVVQDGLCRGPHVFIHLPNSPWYVIFDAVHHPADAHGVPTIRPGQPLRGSWKLYTWNCPVGAATEHFQGTPDNTHPQWTLGLKFEGHDVVPAAVAGSFVGGPDAATQADFYKVGATAAGSLDIIVKNESGNTVPEPGVHLFDPGAVADATSGRLNLALVADSSNSIVFAPSTRVDGTVFMWKTDTVTVVIAGHTVAAVPGAPFSAMTATGQITFSDQTATSPLASQTTSYSIPFPSGATGAGNASTVPQNFQWQWFNHEPFGDISAPTSRTVTYAVDGMINDTFGNSYPVARISRTYRIDVAATKLNFVAASKDSYAAAAFATAASIVAGIVAAAAATVPIYGWITGLVAGAIAAAFSAAAAIEMAVANGQLNNAEDPPAADPRFKELVPVNGIAGEPMPETKGLENLREYLIACSTVTRIYPAITTTEGRVLGALAGKDHLSAETQQKHLGDLLQTMSQAATRMQALTKPAIEDIGRSFDTVKYPELATKLSNELAKWPTEGIPAKASQIWSGAGLTAKDIEVVRKRMAEAALRKQVMNYSETFQSLSKNLAAVASNTRADANRYLLKKVPLKPSPV
jgi:hypothetical protein